MNKRLLLLTSLIGVLSITSCSSSTSNNVRVNVKPSIVENKFIMENGVSTYWVVTSKNAQSKELFAASEFTYFMGLSTGYNFPMVTEKEIRTGQHYISLGVTDQFKYNFPNYNYKVLDGTQSGYFIATRGENIFIVCSDDYAGDGVLYGVYDLLTELIGYTYYHDQEIYYEKKTTINLRDYKQTFVRPSYDMRSISTVYTYTNDLHTKRMKLINNSRGSEWCRGTWGHGQIQKILGPWMTDPKDPDGRTYGQSHPDWFTDPNMPQPAQIGMIDNCLNWCAGPEIEEAVADKLFDFIKAEPDCKFVMCAQEDNSSTCMSLPGVVEALESWAKGSYSALQIKFMNNVINLVEKKLNEDKATAGREIQYVIFAYHTTLEPPLDDYGNPVIKLHKKLRVYIAPINANYSVSFSSPLNKDIDRIFKGWQKVAYGKMFIYLYDLNYRIYFVNFNNFGSCAAMYRELLNYGATYIMTQGVSDSNAPCLDEMRVYCEANLMWNVNLNYDELAYDFIEHYYKEVAPQMKDFYNLIRNRYAYYQSLVDTSSGGTTGNIDNPDLYPVSFVRQMDLIIKDAFSAIKEFEHTDNEYYTMLYNRIMKEYLEVIYLKVARHPAYFATELDELRETFNYYTKLFGIVMVGEGINIEGVLD